MALTLSPDSFSLYVSHTGTTYYVSHFFNYTLPLSHLDIFRSFHSTVRAHFDLLSRDPLYIMASQDLISQYSADMNGIPPSQPDRSRTPPRHQHGWHQASTGVPWPDALCHDDPSTLLEPIRNTASATYVSIVPNTPTMDLTYGTFSAHAASELTDTSQQRQFCTSTPSFHTEIAETYVIPGASSTVNEGYTCRPIEIPPVENWKPDVDFHDSNKINGLDFPSRIRQSRFSSYKDIEGMDPLQVPLWKFLYQGLHNTWLRRLHTEEKPSSFLLTT